MSCSVLRCNMGLLIEVPANFRSVPEGGWQYKPVQLALRVVMEGMAALEQRQALPQPLQALLVISAVACGQGVCSAREGNTSAVLPPLLTASAGMRRQIIIARDGDKELAGLQQLRVCDTSQCLLSGSGTWAK